MNNESRVWNTGQLTKEAKMKAASEITSTKIVPFDKVTDMLEAVIRPGEIVALEGDNQKQATVLSKALTKVNPEKVHGLHMVLSCPQMNEHLDIFELGIAKEI